MNTLPVTRYPQVQGGQYWYWFVKNSIWSSLVIGFSKNYIRANHVYIPILTYYTAEFCNVFPHLRL